MHVAITGASSGIGEALAREYFRRGEQVTLVARRRELLEQLRQAASTPVHLAVADLSDPAQQLAWIPEAEAANGPIDVLINNAGVQIVAPFVETDWKAAQQLLELDLTAPLRLSQHVGRAMASRGRGTLVDVTSMAAIAPTPGMAFYNAAKGGLAAASEALRAELKPLGVHVVTVYPGPVRTALEAKGRASYEASRLAELLAPTGDAAVLARLVARAVERRAPRVIYPRLNVFARYFPAVTRRMLDAFTPKLKALPR
ncbi:MAG: SDR family NAD(P)-dependent oxidoreductase [Myxococcaceae bacterium]|nr:SDR family NAD(P)-dependent oxidoreductase [Myxococcaceae bacterium]